MSGNVTFETIKSIEVKFGENNFIEIAKKKAIPEDGEENTFISISRGFFTKEEEEPRFKKSVAMPSDKEVIEAISKALLDVLKTK
ncbi:MAG: hypothetical protein K0B02_02720 [DPANN group archaeon]|nr:hypothetical protein [DPANN group archaeon]